MRHFNILRSPDAIAFYCAMKESYIYAQSMSMRARQTKEF